MKLKNLINVLFRRPTPPPIEPLPIGSKWILKSEKGNPFVDYHYEIIGAKDGWVKKRFFGSGGRAFPPYQDSSEKQTTFQRYYSPAP